MAEAFALTEIYKHEALVVVRPKHLSLIDLPPYRFFLADIVQALALPRRTVPIFVLGEIGGILIADSAYVSVRVAISSVTICVDVVSTAEDSDIAVPRLCLPVPPVLCETCCTWDWRG